ncbi:unnamed protein product [Chironomus riparius]|uniref:Uncharacterized protein n=1 Tax=Chironomus riparius TaxID=315576 RepID=A0A9N9WZE9_9DIPT|nr:unnamed protein product [Chironomus riparius]
MGSRLGYSQTCHQRSGSDPTINCRSSFELEVGRAMVKDILFDLYIDSDNDRQADFCVNLSEDVKRIVINCISANITMTS